MLEIIKVTTLSYLKQHKHMHASFIILKQCKEMPIERV